MNVPKTHDNRQVSQFLQPYLTHSEAIFDFHWIDNILFGALAARTEGDTATRSLKKSTLFQILRNCQTISTQTICAATNGRYKDGTVAAYAARARVASKAIQMHLDRLPGTHPPQTEQDESHDRPCLASPLAEGYDPLKEVQRRSAAATPLAKIVMRQKQAALAGLPNF